MNRKRDGRLHMRIDARLLERIKTFADRKHITLTTLVEQHFVQLLEEDERVVDAEQI